MDQEFSTFQSWAIVELFGHTQLAGKVTEQTIAGQSFLRIDVPHTTHCPAFTKYHLPSAVYGLTPVDQDYASRMAEHIGAQPVNSYNHHEVIAEIIREKLQDINKQIPETTD
ncbi:MAG TPA: hypothetical protein DEO70_12060 [Bacteroidales bacterium]|nr:MAG: hypothetical protein A2X11_10050 [Bacteroidetes bacterium GWE2_42_24]OFY25854.1 MAG: hypothetical protein A2X09_09425 [Bacteroidetes bacterium GWF2_43_11]HBZ67562.1 hypothetical protein [Bacteroidales bacterium]